MANPNPNTSGLIPFVKGGENKHRHTGGAPRKFVNTIADYGYKPGQIKEVLNVLIALRVDQLEKIALAKDATLLEALIAKALLKGYAKGSIFDLNTILDRVDGLPKQTTEVTTPIDFTKLKVEVVTSQVNTFASREADIDTRRPEEIAREEEPPAKK